ncbi:unnamed protein product [Rotaria sp. Silwood1]|nr:unnamed protein product [Rotaria sp. Silwood1]CAF3766280.1 unnamed protein product [Rotaria sp. Silwood1]CAF4940176.1 unnamed protein product [Rotaria sp. Silwood1]
MRVLLQIPKNPPPQLSVKEYSNAFREFVKFSIHYNISFSNNNNNVRCNDEKGVDSFEDLRCLLQNENKRYPNLSNDFTRIMYEHISKINNICQTSTSQNNSITDNNHIQITSGVVKMTI